MKKVNLYEILGVDIHATAQEIKTAYYRLAQQYHPDLGGDVSKFQELERAYRVLSDPKQREIYDQTGEIPGDQSVLQSRLEAELASMAIQAFAMDDCNCPITRMCESIDHERSGVNSRIANDRYRLRIVTDQLEKFKRFNANVETEAKSLILQAIDAHLIQVQQSIDDATQEVEFCDLLLESLNGLAGNARTGTSW